MYVGSLIHLRIMCVQMAKTKVSISTMRTSSTSSKTRILVSLYFLTHIVLEFYIYVILCIKGSLLSNKYTDFPPIFISMIASNPKPPRNILQLS